MKFSDLHIALSTTESVQHLITSINEQLNGTGVYFQPRTPDLLGGFYENGDVQEDVIIVLVSFDFTSYHQAEMAFHGVIAHNLPEEIWSDAHEQQLMLTSGAERTKALEILRITDTNIHVFVLFDGDGSLYFIAAKKFSWYKGMMYYQRRQSLKEGERVVTHAR